MVELNLTRLRRLAVFWFGLVHVAWELGDNGVLQFELTLPKEVTTTLRLPAGNTGRIILNGQSVQAQRECTRGVLVLPSRTYRGSCE